MNFPTLPKKLILHTQLPDHYWYGDVVGHTDAALQAHGQQCREAAIEAAAETLDDAVSRLAACPKSKENDVAISTLIYQSNRIRSLK